MTTGRKKINAASQEAPQERDEQPQQGRKESMNLIFEIRPDVNGYLHRNRVRACTPCARPVLPGPPRGTRIARSCIKKLHEEVWEM
jgi:hypothetical protein